VPYQDERGHARTLSGIRHDVTVIRGMGIYTPTSTVNIDDIRSWQEPGDGHPQSKLEGLEQQCSELPDSFVWLGLFEPTRDELAIVERTFGLAHLQVEDAANPTQRAKFDLDRNGHGVAILKVLDYTEHSSDVHTGQIAVFVGSWFVVTVRFGQVGDLRGIRQRLESQPELRQHGPISVLYAVTDKVVDEYVSVSDEIGIDIEELETTVFNTDERQDSADRIYRLKRENVEIRRAIGPLINRAHDFVDGRLPWVPEQLQPYFRDVGEHVLRVHDSVEGSDNMLMTMLMASTSLQDFQQNKDMRTISAYVAIAAVPTMIAGIYGMNFDNMPELHQQYGYFVVIGMMLTTCGLLYRAFRKSGWL
jgi:magnesium transporter